MTAEPLLVHIGYHKTATNWLQRVWWSDRETGYRWLEKPRSGPLRQLVLERPLEFDAASMRAAFDPLLARAWTDGLVPVVSYERLSGHPFSGGHDAKEIADRLHAVFPEGRILIVIREQASMILSTYRQYVRVGGPLTVRQFVNPPRSESARFSAFDYRHFEYDHLIRHYRTLFGPESVLALPYELFVRDGRGFVDRIAQFAGRELPDGVLDRLPYARRVNVGYPALSLELMRRLNRFRGGELNPHPVADLRLADGAARWLTRTALPDHPVLRPLAGRAERSLKRAVADAVAGRYADSNRRTAELIGIDLASLGWPVGS